MYKRALYKKVYRLLLHSTPMKYDCGILCGSKCCSGDEESGMQLFPGEEIVLEPHGFLRVSKKHLEDMDILFATCQGTCRRNLRPLSCRIYPLVPYLDKAGRLSIVEDPRAKYICPLLKYHDSFKVDKLFKRKVLQAFRLLVQDAEIHSYIRLLSDVLDNYRRFTGF